MLLVLVKNFFLTDLCNGTIACGPGVCERLSVIPAATKCDCTGTGYNGAQCSGKFAVPDFSLFFWKEILIKTFYGCKSLQSLVGFISVYVIVSDVLPMFIQHNIISYTLLKV